MRAADISAAGIECQVEHDPDFDPADPDEFEIIEPLRSQVSRVIRNTQDPVVTITRFVGVKNTFGSRHDLTWSKLCAVLRQPNESPDIHSLPLIKFSSLPGNSRRSGTAPDDMTAVVGDYDSGKVSVDEAVTRLKEAGIAAVVYTTRRHRPSFPRWRVVVQLAKPVSCTDYSKYMNLINGALGGILAPESWEVSRSYFYGKVNGVEYRFEQIDGLPIDIKVLGGIEWEPVGKTVANIKVERSGTSLPVRNNSCEFDRAIALDQVTDFTIHDLQFALDAIAELADDRNTWNKTFLAAVSLKGSKYEDQARVLIESWSQKYSAKWCEKEDDSTKWDREHARSITYKSIFQMADNQDEKSGLLNTDTSWRAKAKAAWDENVKGSRSYNIVPHNEFCMAMEPPSYIWHRVLQKGCLYALTAKWGHGKTALMITVAMHIATGRELGGHQVKRQRVLYLCGENPTDVQLRTRAAALNFGMNASELNGQIFYTRKPFALDNEVELDSFVQEAVAYGPFGLIVIDTGPAHSSAEEENDNRAMHKLAMTMRDLMDPLGNPATVALMHPTKEATRDNLQPRGGGAFSGSIDGELCAWQERGQVNFFHRTKFRGPGFDPIRFELQRFEMPGMTDNFGEPVVTVLAVASDATSSPPRIHKPLTGAVSVAHRALDAALSDIKTCQAVDSFFSAEVSSALNCSAPLVVVHIDAWRSRAYDIGISDGDGEAKKKAFKRAREKLLAMGFVITWKDMYWLRSAS